MAKASLAKVQPDEELPEEVNGGAPGQEVAVRSELDIQAAMTGVVGKLQLLADKQVQLKAAIEQRWLDDLRQFHGRYDVATENALKLSEKSKLFVNLTRSKVNSWEARLTDLLFPTDDKNWGIKPPPSPHLTESAMRSLKAAKDAATKATEAHQGGDPEQGAAIAAQGNAAIADAVSIQEQMDEANKRSALMEAEIESQLRESDYNIRSRDVVRDMVKLGTGIMKGPVTSQKLRRSWGTPANDMPTAMIQGQAAAPKQYQLQQTPDPAPEFTWIDPWSFFPDMSARTAPEAEFTFERHLWNAKNIRDAVKRLGLNADACADLLRETSKSTIPTYWSQLREITSNSSVIGMETRYQVWEFHGVLEDEDLQAIAAATGDAAAIEFVADNPLLEVPVILWFCQGRVLKFAPYPLDSCESLYSVVPFEPDDTSMFGFGVPYLMRDSQSAINGAWRMTMDNGGLSVGPQIVLDSDAIKPADGSWAIRPMKVWLKTSSSLTKAPESYKPFETFNITANQATLQQIITLARQFADDETNMPLIAAGDMGSHISKTSSGMSMLMNSANVVFRRVVKNFDDCLSTPNIRRIYDWNMQFSKREDIKGDYNIDARGSSVLLVKEMQAQTLMASLMNFSAHPIIGPMLRVPNLLRNLFRAQMIHAEDAVKSDEEIEQAQEAAAHAAAQQGQPAGANDPEVVKAKLQSAEKIASERNASEEKVALINQQTSLMTLAQNHNMTLDELEVKLQINKAGLDHKERMMAVELDNHAARKIGGAEFETPGASA